MNNILIHNKLNFSGATNTYDRWAFHQKVTVERLSFFLPNAQKILNILDVGCGTGLLTSALRNKYRDAHILDMDSSPYMIEYCKNKFIRDDKVSFVVADLENSYKFQKYGSFDLITSSFVMHWIDRIDYVFEQFIMQLNSFGYLALAMPVLGSNKEFLESYNISFQQTLSYPFYRDPEFYLFLLKDFFKIISYKLEGITFFLDNLDILRYFKYTGTKLNLSNASTLSFKEVKRLMSTYKQNYGDSQGKLPLSFNVMFLVCQKK